MVLIRLILSVILASLLTYAQCQSEWHWYNPQPDGNGLRDICILDESHAWAVGESGKILFYNGNIWEKQESGTDKILTSVHFSDTANGYAVGASGTVLKYENGNWKDQSLNINKNFFTVLLTGSADGWIAGDTLLRLVNGQWVGFPYPGGYCSPLVFTSPDNGYMSDWDNLYHFDGTEWSKVEGPSPNYFRGTTDISFFDKDHGMVMTQDFFGSVKKMLLYDHGNWDILPGVTFSPNRLVMTDTASAIISAYDFDEEEYPNSCAMIRYNSAAGFTTDTIVHFGVTSMCISETGQAGAVGYYGNIYLNMNGNWQLTNSINDSYINDISLPDHEHGWAVHGGGLIMKWADNTWKQDTIFSKLYFTGVHFCDTATGWATGLFGENYSYTAMCRYDHGKWQITDTMPASMNAIFVLDRQHAWASGRRSVYFYNGNEWTLQLNSPEYRNFKTVFAYDSVHVWAAGEGYMYAQGTIWFFDGTSWKIESDDFSCNFVSLWVVDSSTAFIVDRTSGQVLKYNRATGESGFMPANVGYLNSIRMFDAHSGWVTGENGALAYFDGTDWNPVDIRTHNGFKVVCFADRDHGWLGGGEGSMLSTYAWSPLAIQEPELLNDQPSFLHVYPNPVISQVIIEYLVPVANITTLKIFDLEGKLALYPVNEYKRDGRHQLNLDISSFKPGIYFCQLNDGRNVSTIKLIKME